MINKSRKNKKQSETFFKNMNQSRTLAVFLFIYYHHLLSGVVSEFTPVVTAPVVYTTTPSQCDQYVPLQDEQLMDALQQVKEKLPKQPSLMVNNSSCKSIRNCNPSAPSGFYQITSTNGSLVQVYCDMEGANCGGEGGWTRVAFVNMTKPGATCPQGLDQEMFDGSSYCGRFASSSAGCVSAVVDNIISYQKVCGSVLGYQQHGPDAFRPYTNFNANISGVYFDGLAIMSGNPRRHIWSYTAGFNSDGIQSYDCPCNNGSTQSVIPSFVGNDYYCESGYSIGPCNNTIYNNDVLWDGQQCTGLEAACCTHPNMPWFTKTLNETTTDDIELRACQSNDDCKGSVPIFLIELYVR